MRYIGSGLFTGGDMRRFSFLVTAAVLLLCTAPLHAQLVTNGTLTANANGWTLVSSCADAVWDGTTGNPQGSIRLNSCGQADSDPTAAQTIGGLVVGATYTIKVDVHLHADLGGGTGKSFGIFLDTEPGNPLLLTEFLDGGWHTVTTSFTAGSTSATIIFAGELDARTPGGPGSTTDVSYFIDNISVSRSGTTAVPTMSERALFALGILLAAFGALALSRGLARRSESR